MKARMCYVSENFICLSIGPYNNPFS